MYLYSPRYSKFLFIRKYFTNCSRKSVIVIVLLRLHKKLCNNQLSIWLIRNSGNQLSWSLGNIPNGCWKFKDLVVFVNFYVFLTWIYDSSEFSLCLFDCGWIFNLMKPLKGIILIRRAIVDKFLSGCKFFRHKRKR